MTDWEAIFHHYIWIVCQSEGVDFLDEADWTPEDWKAITDSLDLDVDWRE